MGITINHSTDKLDYFTLTDDQGNEYQWHCRKGSKLDPEKVLLLIRKREYPGAKFEIQEGQTKLEATEAWIADGHTNIGGQEIKVIEKVPWVPTHPQERVIDGQKISGKTWSEFHAATTIRGLREVLAKILLGGAT